MSKTISELKNALQRIWPALPQKSIAKGVKDFPKQLENSVSVFRAFWILNHWHACFWYILPYDFITVKSLFQKNFETTEESCNELLKFRRQCYKNCCSSHKYWDKLTKIGTSVRIWMANNWVNFRLQRMATGWHKSKNAKVLRGLLFDSPCQYSRDWHF